MRKRGPDFEVLKKEILDLHRVTIEAHLRKDVDFLVGDISEDYVTVSNGEIRYPTAEEIRSTFTRYLDNTAFSEYRDLCEPIVGFSDDGSVAWSVVRVKVAGRTVANGSERELDFICAWITLYRRRGDRWIRVGEVSSFK